MYLTTRVFTTKLYPNVPVLGLRLQHVEILPGKDRLQDLGAAASRRPVQRRATYEAEMARNRRAGQSRGFCRKDVREIGAE